MTSTALVTGGTGMLGSHIAQRLVAQGTHTRALVRPGSQTEFLKDLGVDLIYGDLTSPADCLRAVDGVDFVYHSAAKVGDWGRWHEFQTGCLDATEHLGKAALTAGVGRFLHISSTSAYGHPTDRPQPIDESAPMGQNVWWVDPYTRSKIECERILWRLSTETHLPITVIRPSWLYGERDRTTVPRLIDRLRRGQVRLVGPGDNPLSAIYVGLVADAAILAANHPNGLNQAFNITQQGPLTQAEFLNLFAAACGAKPVRRRVPYRLVFAVATAIEMIARLRGRKSPPLITRYATWLLGRRLSYSTAKAEALLGWKPGMTYAESITQTVRWHLDREKLGPMVSSTVPRR